MKGPKIGYIDILDHFTLEAERENNKVAKDPRRPSSAGRCTRELSYALLEYLGRLEVDVEPRDPEVTRLLALGHYVEESIQEQFKKYVDGTHVAAKYSQQSVDGFEVTSDKEPALNLIVEGSLDDVFITKHGKGLIDYKSKKDKFSRFFKTAWDEIDEKLLKMDGVELIGNSECAYWVDIDVSDFVDALWDPFFAANFWQLNFYANTPWAKRKGIDHAAIIQSNKNDSRLREIRFKPSEKLYNRLHEKFQAATNAAANGNPKEAPRDFSFNSIKCAFCPYSADCYSEEEISAKQAYFDTFPNKSWPKDTAKLGNRLAKQLESLYAEYDAGLTAKQEVAKIEDELIKTMLDNNVKKVRFKDGKIYHLKYLKSPRPHYELRRTKL